MIQYNDISIDCAATKIHIDLTGGWKSALLLYLCAKDINENYANKASIVPCATKRINRYNVENMYRPNAVTIVEKQIAWVSNAYPDVNIEPLLSIDVDFWWLPIISINRRSLDVSEKALLRHVYETCTSKVYTPENLKIDNMPLIKSFNAFCNDADITDPTERNVFYRKKYYEHGIKINDSEHTISLCNGDVIATRPFADTTKTELVAIAKDLNIFDSLVKVTYTCEQSTTDYIDPCGVCFNCKQMKRAVENND